jgi:hypothetical protein
MNDSPGLSTIPLDAPIEGPDATALMVRAELESAALLLRMAEIPVVSQDYHNGMYFHNRLFLLSISYFTYHFAHSSIIFKPNLRSCREPAFRSSPATQWVSCDHGNHNDGHYGFPRCQQSTSFSR